MMTLKLLWWAFLLVSVVIHEVMAFVFIGVGFYACVKYLGKDTTQAWARVTLGWLIVLATVGGFTKLWLDWHDDETTVPASYESSSAVAVLVEYH